MAIYGIVPLLLNGTYGEACCSPSQEVWVLLLSLLLTNCASRKECNISRLHRIIHILSYNNHQSLIFLIETQKSKVIYLKPKH